MESYKNDVFAYLDWRGDLSFRQSPFNEVDALILTVLSYLNMECIPKYEISFVPTVLKKFQEVPEEEKCRGLACLSQPTKQLLERVAKTERFREMGVCRYVTITDEEREMQFAAITFLLPDGTAFLAFRGTDNTLIGWKEDFNMAFTDGVPSQLAAASYANNIMAKIACPVRLGGHSKGGNLAVWAGAHLEEEYKERLLGIYSNDGPGFSAAFLESSEYQSVRNKIFSFVPDESIVGVLMEHDDFQTIASVNPSIMQHDPFSWLVRGTRFVYKDGRDQGARQLEHIINSWLKSLSRQERIELVENVYDIIASSHAKTIDDLDKKRIRSLLAMHKTLRYMDEEKKKQLRTSIGKLIFHNEHLLESESAAEES